jgi:CheY-like chemotaxis protein
MNYSILLVEDDDVDIVAVERAFKKANIANQLFKAANGLEALNLLRSGKIHRPIIVLLDLNMPLMNGLEFLEEIRRDGLLGTIPIVVLTSSKEESDVIKAYENYVAGYLLKPVTTENFVTTMAALGKYWSLCEIK